MDWMDRGPQPREGYDTMQVCLNGHQICTTAVSQPQFKQDHCAECGARTITACEKCQTSIRGYYYCPGVISITEPDVPKFCIKCGSPYPWQETALQQLHEILQQAQLSDAELQNAVGALPDLVRDTPKTQLAVLKFKGVLAKLKKPVADATTSVLTTVATEAVKKLLGL